MISTQILSTEHTVNKFYCLYTFFEGISDKQDFCGCNFATFSAKSIDSGRLNLPNLHSLANLKFENNLGDVFIRNKGH